MTVQVDLVNYGVGNLHSIRKALETAGAVVDVRTPDQGLTGDAVVLPGVGAFGEAARRLAPMRDELVDHVRVGRPLLGVCLGLQLLFESSDESPGAGLGVIKGRVRRLENSRLPQIGWNEVALQPDPLWQGFETRTHVYFVNSFAPVPEEDVEIASAVCGKRFTAAVRKVNAWGVQFHPEKSSVKGLLVVKNFVRLAEGMKK
ncbi:MAG: imidazole glycerol phosphate synthase subunit HisH [Euryarchaeota archaeon]|nr:imidazole glycerol phosphate synthase subunit HisH [Euryarchaeota archaeon]